MGRPFHPSFSLSFLTFPYTICNYRKIHKLSAKVVLLLTWFTAFMGLNTLTTSPVQLAIFGVPLMVIAPMILM
jgi:hypothetical protein